MNIHEYQAKQILANYGVPTPVGYVAFSGEEAQEVAKKIDTNTWVVKAQIHAGGRGKAGGVKVLRDINLVRGVADQMIGMNLVTHQTGAEGRIVQKVYVEAGSVIKKEYYISLLVDRNSSSIVIIASTEGGMDIEEIALHNPEKLIKVFIDPAMGLQNFHIEKIVSAFGFNSAQSKNMRNFINKLYKAFIDIDASQVEINPLIENDKGEFVALDAKFNLDPNALFKHPEIAAMDDPNEKDELEVQAAKFDLNYIKMEGNIGCMVNGAGLAMATMDIIQLHGGKPANFLDVGGGATVEKVTEAFKIITADKSVQGILVNIFGGIMRCDIIANGIVTAAKEIGITVPVVVRLEGTNADKGKAIINSSGLSFKAAEGLVDAAQKIVHSIGLR